jgi:membrane protease YdiL (CAAX protease family)
MDFSPWSHIFAAYLIYILIAVLTSALVGKIAGDLKDFRVRNSPRVLLMGAIANLIAMGAILLLLIFWDKKPLSAIGLQLHQKDIFVALIGFVGTFILAIGFLCFLGSTRRISSVETRRPATSSEFSQMSLGMAVLVPVILQEEVLNRAYVTLNLLPLGPAGIILASTVIFVLIHFLTNRGNFPQVVSWIASGLVLISSYVLSGSIWVPVILHYATDTANVLVFNITGQFSFFQTTPAITEGQRAAFRVIYGIVIIAILLAIYGLNFRFG